MLVSFRGNLEAVAAIPKRLRRKKKQRRAKTHREAVAAIPKRLRRFSPLSRGDQFTRKQSPRFQRD